jgi:hypothetical protein
MDTGFLLDLARDVLENRIDFSGACVPTQLIARISALSRVDDELALQVSQLVLRSMGATKAVSNRLRSDHDDTDFDDCAFA